MGFEASNLTQVPLQPSCADSNHTHFLTSFQWSWLLGNDHPYRV